MKRSLAVPLAVLLICALLLVNCMTVVLALHDCPGSCCAVCQFMERAFRFSDNPVLQAGMFVIILLPRRTCRIVQHVFVRSSDTLRSMMVKLQD